MNILIVSAALLVAISILHNILSAVVSPSIPKSKLSLITYRLASIAFVPIHELSHYIACLLFGHKVNDVQLINLSFNSDTLGHVNHSWNPRSLYQSVGCFFIAISPMITAAIVVYVLFVHNENLPIDHLFYSKVINESVTLGDVLRLAAHNVIQWVALSTESMVSFGKLLLVIMLCFFCIPSSSDFKNAGTGFVSLLVLVALCFGIYLLVDQLIPNITDSISLSKPLSALATSLVLTASASMIGQLFWVVLFGVSLIRSNSEF